MAKFHGQFSTEGLFAIGQGGAGCWIREKAAVRFHLDEPIQNLSIAGEIVGNGGQLHSKFNRKKVGLSVRLNGKALPSDVLGSEGRFTIDREVNAVQQPSGHCDLQFELEGVKWSNFLALCGRLIEKNPLFPKSVREWLQPFRRQYNNRQLRVLAVFVNNELLIDFEKPHSSFSADFLFKHSGLGLNLIGWYHGYLGVGESVRACNRAATAVGLDCDAVNMKLHLVGGKSSKLWDQTMIATGTQSITIAHVDAPQSFDLKKNHPVELSDDCYRIGYWAWELPEFPDAWIQYSKVFDEIWCPSEFCREAISAKLPIPVFTMPHAIEVNTEISPLENSWRERFALPEEMFLFLFTFDLNSYSPRKNPEAVIEAFKLAFGANKRNDLAPDVGVVLKMHGGGYNNDERRVLDGLRNEVSNVFIVDETLTRKELTGLQMACDCFVSLHRSEGFGLGVAEMMALGKPVISTNWSATSEFVNDENGCPVNYELVELEANVGPYTKGQIWADANVAHAAEWMVRIVEDDEFRKKIGQNAKSFIETNYSSKAIGSRYLERIKSISLF